MKPIIIISLSLALNLPIHAQEAKKNGKNDLDQQEAFVKKDTDGDGYLSKEEFVGQAKKPAKAEENFSKKDKNNDGKLSFDEVAGRKKGAK